MLVRMYLNVSEIQRGFVVSKVGGLVKAVVSTGRGFGIE